MPFYLRTGKAPARAGAREIAIQFKQAPVALFRDTPVERLAPNFLVLRIQPDEGITLHFNAKVPGPTLAIDGVGHDFKYKDYFDAAPSTGYETLIYDCMIGDATLFQRADKIEAGWRAVQPFLDAWGTPDGRGLAAYAAGSEGPRRPTPCWRATVGAGGRSGERRRRGLCADRFSNVMAGPVPATSVGEAPALIGSGRRDKPGDDNEGVAPRRTSVAVYDMNCLAASA